MTFRQRIEANEVLVGALLNVGSAVTAEIMARSGFDWLVIDLEHGSGGEWQALAQLQAAGSGFPVLVRVEELERARFGRALDLGAAGILVPRVESGTAARLAVSYCKYAGSRGVARYNRAWGWGTRDTSLDEVDADVVCAVQVETAVALDALDDIASVEGVDALVVGPIDLASSLSSMRAGELALDEGIAAVARAAKAYGKAAGIIAPRLDDLARYRELGFTLLAHGSDSSLLAVEARRVAAAMQTVKAKPIVEIVATGE